MRKFIVIVVAAITPAAAAQAHDDVVPYAHGGKIVTGGHDDLLGSNNIVQHVFGFDFGEDPLDPYFIGDPGFNNGTFAIGVFPNDGLLPGGFTLSIESITNLQYWDGSGGVAFGAAGAGISLGLNRASSTVLISGTGLSGTVPTIGSTGSGRLHVHINSLLNATDGVDPNPPNAPEGIYLVGLELTLPGSTLANSDPIYFVYNNNLDEEIHDLAIDWVEDTLVVPEPATWVMSVAALAAFVGAGWRKRRRGLA